MENPSSLDIQNLLSSLILQVTDAFSHNTTANSTFNKDFSNQQKLNLSDSSCMYEGTEIQIIKCYKQVDSDICGFHCLFNLLQFLNLFAVDLACLKEDVTNGAKFWKCYKEIYDFLQTNYPNKKELKLIENFGPLERVHMEYVLENLGDIKLMEKWLHKEAGIKLFILPFYFGFDKDYCDNMIIMILIGIMQNSEEDLKKIQDLAVSLTEKEDNVLMMFPLGITIHWSLLVLLKRNNKLEAFYMDSKNVKLEHIFKGEIQEAIRDLEEASQHGKEKIRNEIDEKRQLTWMKDLMKSIEILMNVVNRKKTLIEYTIEGNIEETLNDFNAYLSKEKDKNSLTESTIKKIYQWFEDEYRPQVILNNLLKPLSASNTLDKEHYSRLKEFKDICKAFGGKIADSNSINGFDFEQKLIEDILRFVEELKLTLTNVNIID